MNVVLKSVKDKIKPEQLFLISVLLINLGNYVYHFILGRMLGPEKFADAALLITLLLVLSFVGITFQTVTAKISLRFKNTILAHYISKMLKYSVILGVVFGAIFIVFAAELQAFFNTNSSTMFVIFGVGIPFYLLMSVNRGLFQGSNKVVLLSQTNQGEMISRLLITVLLLLVLDIESSTLVAAGIFVSLLVGLFPIKTKSLSTFKAIAVEASQNKVVRGFFIVTAVYEFTQMLVSYSDILLVKHYFESFEAGLYASLALTGKLVYFLTWMFVMLLIPTVIQLKKDGRATLPLLSKYVSYISLVVFILIASCYAFPQQIITATFGSSFLEAAPLLWKYALVTGVFAISNIVVYYYVSLEKYAPIILSAIFGFLQMGLIVFYHDSLTEVINVQIIAMFLLLAAQIGYIIVDHKKQQ